MKIRDLLAVARERNASDLHLMVGSAPILRVDGVLRTLDEPPLSKHAVLQMLYDILTEDQKARFGQTREFDFSLDVAGTGRFRGTSSRSCADTARFSAWCPSTSGHWMNSACRHR